MYLAEVLLLSFACVALLCVLFAIQQLILVFEKPPAASHGEAYPPFLHLIYLPPHVVFGWSVLPSIDIWIFLPPDAIEQEKHESYGQYDY